jgi:branched-chain amino acid transport system permease protein
MTTAIIYGLFQGAVYGLLAIGLVLVYKGMRVFNFAQGEFGTIATYITWALYTKADDPDLLAKGAHWFPYWQAALIAIVCTVLIGLIVERIVIRPLLNAPRVTLLVATIGVALLLISVELIWGKVVTRVLPSPFTAEPVTILGVAVDWSRILAMAALGVMAILLFLFFRTDRGLAVLAMSQDAQATRIVGVSVPAMSRLIWGLAAFLGAAAGILYAPIVGVFSPAYMTAAQGAPLIPAFAAAVLGGMDSVAGAFIGALIIGVLFQVGQYLVGQELGVPGGDLLTVFVVLLVVLLIRPQGLLGKEPA